MPDRFLYRNITKGYTTKYEYLIAQHLTVGGDRGRDLSFSPDSNQVAAFARTERSRSLLLLDAINGGIIRGVEIPLPIDQPAQPAWSPDGKQIAFRAVMGGQYDIFVVDLETEEITNITEDESYDAAPAYSPTGESILYTSQYGEVGKIVEIILDGNGLRRQLTFGPGNDEGAAFSKDGKRIYFSSDRDQGVYDIYKYDLDAGKLYRMTKVIGTAVNPTVVETLEGEQVVFQGFSEGGWNLYIIDPNMAEEFGVAEPPTLGVDLEPYIPAVSMNVDINKAHPENKKKLFVENVNVVIGVDQDGNFLSRTVLSMSDKYGDRRFLISLDSIDTFSNFRISWFNMEKRIQWGATLHDFRSFYLFGYDPLSERYTEREQVYEQTGLTLNAQYPLTRHYRLNGSIGYYRQEIDYLQPSEVPGEPAGSISVASDIPVISFSVTGDTVLWKNYGPHQGSRWNVMYVFGFDMEESGAATNRIQFDGRKYLHLSRRNEIALRLFLGYDDGNTPSLFAFGGLDNLRGFPTRSITGNRAGFANIEWRFPLIDRLDLPFMTIGEIRGRVFLDVGAAWYERNGEKYNYLGEPGFTFIEDGRLVDGVSAYGVGFTAVLFGMPMHWDFVKRWDFKDTLSDTETSFWIGYRF